MRIRNWIAPATSVIALFMSIGQAVAAPPTFWSNFYVSAFGGGAVGTGSVTAYGENHFDPECAVVTSDPEFCTFDMTGLVGGGMVGGTAIGMMFAPNMRGEVELSFARLGTSTTTNFWDPEFSTTTSSKTMDSLTATFVFGNIWYDFPIGEQLSGYIGGGAGFAHGMGTFSAPSSGRVPSDLSLTVNGFAPAVQVGGGITYQVAPKITLDFGYRFKEAFGLPVSQASSFDSGLTNVTNSSSINLGVHVVQVGLMFALD